MRTDCLLTLLLLIIQICDVLSNLDAKRLFEDLTADYNKLVRPVENDTDTLDVKFKLRLSQLLDVHEKNQIMTTNVWLEQSWYDYKLKWDPEEYGGVTLMYLPSDIIWLPDIVLYNNADGNYQVTIMTKAKVHFNGTVEWRPPAIYKSMCPIDVTWFPFDFQECDMKFGSWTYGGKEVDLKHHDWDQEVESIEPGTNEKIWTVAEAINLAEYHPESVEWDILKVPGVRHEKRYNCCDSPFIDITYTLRLRRKTLYYTVNLILPSVGISFLTPVVFYLPSDCGEKVSLCISILISLTVFFLLLVEIIPSTSLVIPLIGKYLLFTMVLVTLSVIVTVVTLNVHYRSPTTHIMPRWISVIFFQYLPKILCMRRPTENQPKPDPKPEKNLINNLNLDGLTVVKRPSNRSLNDSPTLNKRRSTGLDQPLSHAKSAVDSVCYIVENLRGQNEEQRVKEDWKYVAMVLDRLFLWIFTAACGIGTLVIMAGSTETTLYDKSPALTSKRQEDY